MDLLFIIYYLLFIIYYLLFIIYYWPDVATLNRSFILLLLLHNAELQMVFLVYALIIFPYEVSFSLRRRTPPMAPKAYCLCEIK